MININKKGFMMAELVVVSAIVLVTLVSLYTSYNKIYSVYKSRVGYYDVATLYRLGYYRDLFNEYDVMNILKDKAKTDKIVAINKVTEKNKFNELISSSLGGANPPNKEDSVFLVYNNKVQIDSSIFGSINVNPTFKDYVDYLKESIDFSNFEYMLVMERCNLDGDSVDVNSCNYAYLEIFPEADS